MSPPEARTSVRHDLPARWSIDTGQLCISLLELAPELAFRVSLRKAEWQARGWLDGDQLVFSQGEWAALGRPVEGAGDDEERESLHEEWAVLQHLLLDLVGLEQQDLDCEVVGVPGGAGARYRVRVSGLLLPDPPQPIPWFVSSDTGEVVLLGPSAAWACVEARLATHAPRKEQLARVMRVRGVLEEVARRLPDRVRYTARGYLGRFQPQPVARVGLRWEQDPEATEIVSLHPYAVHPDGTQSALPLASLQPGGIAGDDARRPLVLPEGAERILENVRPLQRRLAVDVQRELEDPTVIIPEGLNADGIVDLSKYSERVLGFEVLRGRDPTVGIEGSGLEWFDPDDKEGDFSLTLQVDSPEGREAAPLRLDSRTLAMELHVANEAALARGDSAPLVVAGTRLLPSESLRRQLVMALQLSAPEPATTPDASDAPAHASRGRKPIEAVKVKELGASATRGALAGDADPVPWESLRSVMVTGVELKLHQRQGIEWLWRRAREATPGVLLADDMGLGKTLQVACFLTLRRMALQAQLRPGAWLKPQLVVCPTILLENWRQELARFFIESTWAPFILHGPGLEAVKREGELNGAFLARQDLVLTNYETLGAHQRSLLKVDFDVVVFDEAHNLKNPDTLRSRAARALKRSFAVGLTGTPVENELLDVWALYDALQCRQPRVFGTRAAFREAHQGEQAVQTLRQRLGYPSEGCTLLRREKAEALKELPPKSPHRRLVEMTEAQESHERLIARKMVSEGSLWALAALQKLYQHPALLTDARGLSSATALRESPKTRLCLELLSEIESQGSGEGAQKALVFVLSRAMQDLLAQLISERFRLGRVDILNGEPASRKAALDNIEVFSRAKGFQVLILSPLAAGAGLNITAANHVIHYGRWWNPAKEDQATDRAHRIGQVRPVHVYYPLLHRRGRPDAGFDLRLHELVERKRAIARDFLSPTDEDAQQYTGVFQGAREEGEG
ncbi:DEAD/DEAH box helicase [Myxococcus sp. K38C18041901]|uniref:DEAD/DEAH box helicase n=1 Tax=Myxococcus guangdongensis TaxID=2906760 RepID=UPI0020A81E1A|nr:DEAD/DEAH box helicase [Myxococcus guangdongensis]MCP3061107.1 DEAD/DEAH box helicase [Myxococcus guangdongensis]